MKGINNSMLVQKLIGSRIRAARELSKLSRNELAARLLDNELYPEVAPRKGSNEITTPIEKLSNRIKQWERGENPVGLEYIPSICDVLHCDVGYLFGNYDEHYHTFADISAVTGLTEENINRLIFIRDRTDLNCGNVGNICIETAFESLMDYIKLSIVRQKLLSNLNQSIKQETVTGEIPQPYKKVLFHLETDERATDLGYTLLQHKDAIKFYARSIANQLERYLEEVYTDGID